MNSNTYTINDAYHDGFESGVAYVFSHLERKKFDERELRRFLSWIELKNPWKSESEWKELIEGSLRG